MQLKLKSLQQYLDERYGQAVCIGQVSELNHARAGKEALKQFGYGSPLLVDYVVGNQPVREVLHRIRSTPFGRERDDDRVAAVWLDHDAFNQLPRHVPAVDMLAHLHDGKLCSLQGADELLLVTSYRTGQAYADDLLRLRDGGQLQLLDLQRTEALGSYLAGIHQLRLNDPALWRRRLRDLVGHGEGIMGLTDSYPADFAAANADRLRAIEETANRWRWRVKPLHHRLSQVHGDFHPFNILFHEGAEFSVLDRSRGAWGEPADDVSCLTINYIFFSLQRYGQLAEPFQTLYDRFWQRYLSARPDNELLRVIQPWYAWRALVVASPIWYPTIADEVRRKLLAFGEHVMACDEFDYRNPSQYWQEG